MSKPEIFSTGYVWNWLHTLDQFLDGAVWGVGFVLVFIGFILFVGKSKVRHDSAKAQPKPATDDQYISPLSDFQEGQWWIRELDNWVNYGSRTDDQARAVAVVHHLLQSAARAAKESS